ncbi:selenoprotein S [Kryptolebias marmoratus]|uniref:Selenoprotein S n=1 Tax=Kryptolebias marmoratus TaxID=37003 RepID=A0A3Q2ZLE0_KRYMA|nr:selenoprotein S [Kryptolebias marmoratus]
MDEVEIRDLNEDKLPVHPPLKNQDLSDLGQTAAEVLSQYGWYLLAATFTVYLLIQHLRRTISRTSIQDQNPRTQQDASVVARRQESMEAARRKMQEELDAKAAIFKEKQKQQEEEKRRQKIEVWENMKQGKSCRGTAKTSEEASSPSSSSEVRKPKTDKKPLRSTDYNPLMGQGGGSCSWRPGRRGPSAGG